MRTGHIVRATVLSLLLGACALAQEAWETPVKVPPGVRYKQADPAQLRAAVGLIRKALEPGGFEPLFDKMAMCGPFLWSRLATDGRFAAAEGAPMLISNMGAEGKCFMGATSTQLLQDELRSELADDGGFTVRRPTSQELSIYWALIPYDIEEPIFVAESPHHKLLLHFHEGRVFALDDYQGASLNRLEALEAALPPLPMASLRVPEDARASARDKLPVSISHMVLVTDEEALARRTTADDLAAYVRRLESALNLSLSWLPESPGDLLLQFELRPQKAPHVLLQSRPELSPELSRKLEAQMTAVSPPQVKGRAIFQLVVLLHGGTGQPLRSLKSSAGAR